MRFGRYIVGLPSVDKDPLYAPSRQPLMAQKETAAELEQGDHPDPEDAE